ncbi:DMT family transporter [Paenibacillus sp. CMAA1364]
MKHSYMWLIICVTVWGSNFVLGKILLQSFSPSILTMLRLICIVLMLSLIGLVSRQSFIPLAWRELRHLVLLGCVGVFLNQWTFFMGLRTVDSTIAALILATTPIATGLLAAIFLKERVTLRAIGGSFIAMIGIYWVIGGGGKIAFSWGLMWIFLTMLTFAIMIVLTRKLADRLPPLQTTLYSNVVGLLVSIPVAFMVDQPIRLASSSSYSSWLLLICSAIAVHGICNLVWNVHIRNINASKASILSNLEPFIAMITGFILLHKPITGVQLAGSCLIIGGVVWVTLQKRSVGD